MATAQKSVTTKLLLLTLAVILSPVMIIALIIAESAAFGTRYLSNSLEAIGLTPVLEKIFSALGING